MTSGRASSEPIAEGLVTPSEPRLPPRILLVFLDGVGIGAANRATNPFLHAALPTLTSVLGGRLPTLDEPVVSGAGGFAFPLDATLDVGGTPQSGTGQVALLTGVSAAELFGGHFGPWTPVRFRPVVEEQSLLRQAMDAGRSVAFANAYPRGWPGPKGGRRIAAPPLAARGAGVLNRHEEALSRGEAVSSEIVNDGWQRALGHDGLPSVTEEEAGANLSRIANSHDATLFAHYATDTAGHVQDMSAAIGALERVDAFLGGLLTGLADDVLLIIASDHGNIEDISTGHTRNPALGVAVGHRAGDVADLRDLRHVAPRLLSLLS